MTIENPMSDESSERQILFKIGEVSSSSGEKVDLVTDIESLSRETVTRFARDHGIPGPDVPRDMREIVEAASRVNLTGVNMTHKSLEDIFVHAAVNVETVAQNSNLSQKQKEFASGLVENLIGDAVYINSQELSKKDIRAIGRKGFFLGRADQAEGFSKARDVIDFVKSQARRKAIEGALVMEMALVACGPIRTPDSPINAPTSMVEIVDDPGIIIEPSVTPSQQQGEISSTPTEAAHYVASYPTSPENFIEIDSSQIKYGDEAKAEIIKNGGEATLKEIEDMYKAEFARKGMNPANYTFEPYFFAGNGVVAWDCAVKDSNGRILGMVLTEGPDKGAFIRQIGLAVYTQNFSSNEDFFDFSTIENPPGYEGAIQRTVADGSGWAVRGLFQGETMVAWYNADAAGGAKWIIDSGIATGPEVVSTVEAYPTTLSADEVAAGTALMSTADTWPGDSSEYITNLMAERNTEWTNAGFNLTDSTKEDYVQPKFVIQKDAEGKIIAWDYLLFDKDGGVAAWLQIKDPATGNWKWAEGAMWDPDLTTVEGESQYILPEKLQTTVKITKDSNGNSVVTFGSSDRYGIVYVGENQILIEYDKDGNAKRWLNEASGKMEWLEGVDKIIYTSHEGGPISVADAQKIAGQNAETVYFNSFGDEMLAYMSGLFDDLGIPYTEGPNGPRVSLSYDIRGDAFIGVDGQTKYGVSIAQADGSRHYGYRDKDGVARVIENVTK